MSANGDLLQPRQPKFNPGLLVITPAAQARLNPISVFECLARHLSGDWGDAAEDEKKTNDLALENGLRILSRYRDSADEQFWIITEADRSSTTVLLPEEF